MNEVQIRYSEIKDKFPREFVLLQGQGCFWKKCAFCDYFHDVSSNAFEINKEVIDKITGKFGVLDVINSGSAMEIDDLSLNFLAQKVKECKIQELWFEVHWAYRNTLKKFTDRFPGIDVKFRTGIETFDPMLRNFWNKGVPSHILPEDVAKYFKSVCLLVGTERQTFETVISDINIAKNLFEHFMVNVFVPNSTSIKSNPELIKKFMKEIYPQIKDDPQIEISLNITDLGVG